MLYSRISKMFTVDNKEHQLEVQKTPANYKKMGTLVGTNNLGGFGHWGCLKIIVITVILIYLALNVNQGSCKYQFLQWSVQPNRKSKPGLPFR